MFKTNQIHSCEGLLVSICTLHLIFFSGFAIYVMLSGTALKKRAFLEIQYCWLLYQKYYKCLKKYTEILESSQHVFLCGIVMNPLKFVEECVE